MCAFMLYIDFDLALIVLIHWDILYKRENESNWLRMNKWKAYRIEEQK